MAVANSLFAIKYGARRVERERAGNAVLEEVVALEKTAIVETDIVLFKTINVSELVFVSRQCLKNKAGRWWQRLLS